jgi:AcrR family transcriptional regulator
MDSARRPRSARGDGAALRGEILSAAAELLEANGNEAAVTLRAIAREVGITAPAIYGHFPDRQAILDTVVADACAALIARMRTAQGETPRERLFASCDAYVAFAADQPARYRVLFERFRPSAHGEARAALTMDTLTGGDAFGMLVASIGDCIASGDSEAAEPHAPALAVWVAIHGYASLRASLPRFPWPQERALLDDLIARLAQLTA